MRMLSPFLKAPARQSKESELSVQRDVVDPGSCGLARRLMEISIFVSLMGGKTT
jgi:hypothetical protein